MPGLHVLLSVLRPCRSPRGARPAGIDGDQYAHVLHDSVPDPFRSYSRGQSAGMSMHWAGMIQVLTLRAADGLSGCVVPVEDASEPVQRGIKPRQSHLGIGVSRPSPDPRSRVRGCDDDSLTCGGHGDTGRLVAGTGDPHMEPARVRSRKVGSKNVQREAEPFERLGPYGVRQVPCRVVHDPPVGHLACQRVLRRREHPEKTGGATSIPRRKPGERLLENPFT